MRTMKSISHLCKATSLFLTITVIMIGFFFLLSCDTDGTSGELECIDFEDLALGTVYSVSDQFKDSGTCILASEFQWFNLTWTRDGYSEVTADGQAGGSGQEMWFNNINLVFVFCRQLTGLTLKFGEYGGNLNIKINDDFQNFENFDDIHGDTIGGVSVTISGDGDGQGMGTLTLSGTIDSFSIGGQELAIDDVCPQQ